MDESTIYGDQAESSLAFVLTKQLEGYKGKIMGLRKKGMTPASIGIGGPISVILEAAGVKVNKEVPILKPVFMDLNYLYSQHFLVPPTDKFYYKFHLPGRLDVKVELPNLAITSLEDDPMNAMFIPDESLVTDAPPSVPAATQPRAPPAATPGSSKTKAKTPRKRDNTGAPIPSIDEFKKMLKKELREELAQELRDEVKKEVQKHLGEDCIRGIAPSLFTELSRQLCSGELEIELAQGNLESDIVREVLRHLKHAIRSEVGVQINTAWDTIKTQIQEQVIYIMTTDPSAKIAECIEAKVEPYEKNILEKVAATYLTKASFLSTIKPKETTKPLTRAQEEEMQVLSSLTGTLTNEQKDRLAILKQLEKVRRAELQKQLSLAQDLAARNNTAVSPSMDASDPTDSSTKKRSFDPSAAEKSRPAKQQKTSAPASTSDKGHAP